MRNGTDKVTSGLTSFFPDPEHGEWFGYLHRDGSISSTLEREPLERSIPCSAHEINELEMTRRI